MLETATQWLDALLGISDKQSDFAGIRKATQQATQSNQDPVEARRACDEIGLFQCTMLAIVVDCKLHFVGPLGCLLFSFDLLGARNLTMLTSAPLSSIGVPMAEQNTADRPSASCQDIYRRACEFTWTLCSIVLQTLVLVHEKECYAW